MQKIKYIALLSLLFLASVSPAKESLKLKAKKSTVQTSDMQGAADETAEYKGK
jgi:hypothetical protein